MKTTTITIALSFFALLLCDGCGSSKNKVTKENYEQIKVGMTKEQVIQLLGQPDQIVEQSAVAGIKADLYTWNDIGATGGKSISVFFHNGKVYNKAWSVI